MYIQNTKAVIPPCCVAITASGENSLTNNTGGRGGVPVLPSLVSRRTISPYIARDIAIQRHHRRHYHHLLRVPCNEPCHAVQCSPQLSRRRCNSTTYRSGVNALGYTVSVQMACTLGTLRNDLETLGHSVFSQPQEGGSATLPSTSSFSHTLCNVAASLRTPASTSHPADAFV